MELVGRPAAEGRVLRTSLPVSKEFRNTHSYLRLRDSRSMETLSIHRPGPGEMPKPASFSVWREPEAVELAALNALLRVTPRFSLG